MASIMLSNFFSGRLNTKTCQSCLGKKFILGSTILIYFDNKKPGTTESEKLISLARSIVSTNILWGTHYLPGTVEATVDTLVNKETALHLRRNTVE